jgi:VCBS repeat-containing protein
MHVSLRTEFRGPSRRFTTPASSRCAVAEQVISVKLACARARRAAQIFLVLALLLGLRAAFGANSVPVANPDSYTVNEDTTLSVSSPGVLGNDTDAENNSLSTVLVSNVTHGTLTLNSGGSFTYRPSTNYNGGDSFIYRAKDSSGTSAPVTVTITINPTNDVPRATNDTYAVNSDTTLNVLPPGVLENDFDPDGDELRTMLATNVTHGTLALNTNGSFTYAPAAGYAGNDSFAYRAADGTATSAVVIATINVVPAPIVVATPPLNQTNCVGDTAVFSVTATGTALKYQWLKGSTTLASQTNDTLVLPNLATGDAGTYRVRLTGATNSITNSATLTVSTPFTVMPMTNLLRFVGSIAIFNSTATGGGSATYSWLRDGVVIPGETSSKLVLSNLTVGDSATYAAVVSGVCASVTNSATLEVATCFPSIDVMLVIDRSASMLGQPYDDARTACTNFVRNLQYGATNDMAGFVIYNPTSSLRVPLTNNLAVLEQTVAGFPAASGGTCISCGLTNAQGALFSNRHRSNALPVMVLMSDGLPKVEDGDSPSNVLYFAQQAKNAGTRIFTVGLGAVDFSLMSAAASSTNDFFYTTNSSQLSALFDTISSIICRPPTNILGPVDATVCAGATASFNVVATGCEGFTYQWRKNGVPLAGQTNSTLTLNNVAATNAGVYSVLVSAPCRTVVNSATLTVNTPAQIVTGPANLTGFVGSNVTFSVAATGTALSYAWFRDGALLGTSSTLALSNLTTNDARTYCVAVTGGLCGGPVTNCATLTIQNRPPVALNDAYTIGEDTALIVNANGVLGNDSDPDGDALQSVLVSPPAHGTLALDANGGFIYTPDLNFNGADSFSYQAGDGKTNSGIALVSITVTPVNDVPVANNDAYTMTADTTLTVAAPGVLANDTDAENNALSALLESNPAHGTLTLNANGSFTYQPNSNYSGSDSFTYRAGDGGATSGVATVTITINPVPIVIVVPPPTGRTNCPGDTTTFSVVATGTALTYQWIFNNEILAGATNSSITLQNLNATNAGTYCAVVGGASGGPITNCAVLVVNENVIISTPPSDLVVCENALAQFTVNATGTALAYQWYFGSATLSNQTTDTLTLNNVSLSRAGSYSVAVSGACGSTVTNSVTLTVNQNVQVLSAPAAQTSFVGSNATFNVGAIGTGVSYEWFFNGALISTSNALALSNLATNQAGIYCVIVSGVCGAPITNCTTLTIENRAPVAGNDAYSVAEDSTLMIDAAGILANDSDLDGDTLSAVLVSDVTHGVLGLNSNGAFIYTPSLNYTGIDTFTYRASDTRLTSGIATVTITITPLNDPPVALDDSYSVNEDATLTIPLPGVLANDTDVDGDALRAVLVSNVTHGTLSLSNNGAFVYTPSLSYTGVDVFTYRATATGQTSDVATVTITVLPLNDAPVANDDAYTILEDTTLAISAAGILTNDFDVDGNSLTALLVSNVAHGSLTFSNDGAFVYTPSLSYTGVDVFAYRVTDGALTSSVATVTITILPVNDRPVAVNDDFYTTAEDTTLTIAALGVLANDVDVDGDALQAVLVSGVAHGTLSLSNNGAFIYTPSLNYTGADTFTYRATDGALTSDVATVTITITPLNDAPVAVADDFYTTLEDTTLTVPALGILANDIDVDGNPLASLLVSNVTHGTLNLSTNGAFTYTPSLNYTGVDTFVYLATDGALTSGLAVVTITVLPTNDAPVAVADDFYTTLEDTTLTVPALGVLANDIDVDGDPLSAVLVSDVTHGTLTLNGNGAFNYTPSLNYTGLDTFTYHATDGSLTSGVATVTITIVPVNDPPTTGVLGDAYSVLEDQTLTIPAPGVLANDGDVDGDALTAVLVGNVSHGALVLNADGSFTYLPAANYFGPDSFTYRASDGQTSSEPATVNITITPVNDAPTFANVGEQKVNQNSPAQTVSWASSISPGPANESEQTLAFLVSNDNNGLFSVQPSIAPNGMLTYTPAPNTFGIAHVHVHLRDNGGTANGGVDTSGEIIFRILVNSPPSISIVSPADGTGLLFPATFSVIASASDPDGSVTNVQFLVNNTNFIRLAAAPFYFVLSNATPGNYQFQAVATDDFGLARTSSVVNVEVITNAVVATGPIVLNHQNGLFEQFVTVSNRTSETWANGVRLFVRNMDTTNQVYNATGTNGGVPYLDKIVPVPAGQSTTLLVQYYVPNPRSIPNPILIATPLPFSNPAATPQLTRISPAANGLLQIEFTAQSGRFYFIQYSEDFSRWFTDPAPVKAASSTASALQSNRGGTRFYRVMLAP